MGGGGLPRIECGNPGYSKTHVNGRCKLCIPTIGRKYSPYRPFRGRIFKLFKDARDRFPGIDPLREIISVVELILGGTESM